MADEETTATAEETAAAAAAAAGTAVAETANGASGEEKVTRDDDWQTKARKHERDAKKARADAEALKAQLAEREEADKTEQEKALDQARKEAADAARSETTKTYREKILSAEIRAQAAGKFANPALAIKLLDLDQDAIFDGNGEIDVDAITTAIDEFLEQEPGLKAGPPNGGRPAGSVDAGKGSPAGKDLEAMTPDDHLKVIQNR